MHHHIDCRFGTNDLHNDLFRVTEDTPRAMSLTTVSYDAMVIKRTVWEGGLMAKLSGTVEIKEHSSPSKLFMATFLYSGKSNLVTCNSSILLALRKHSASWHFAEKHTSQCLLSAHDEKK